MPIDEFKNFVTKYASISLENVLGEVSITEKAFFNVDNLILSKAFAIT